MPLKIPSKGSSSAPASQEEQKSTSQSSGGTLSKLGGGMKSQTSDNTSTASFLKKGAAAKQAVIEADAAAELRKQEAGKMFDFWISKGESKQALFLDGDLNDEGMLDINMYHQHTVKVNGDWQDFPCVGEHEPCPICEKGENRSTLVGVMTVIDMTPYKIKNGKNAGKTIVNTRKLFVAKHETLAKLTKKAQKQGGSLAGCVFDVSRSTSDNAARVGDDFEFEKKFESFNDIAADLKLELEEVMPADYSKEITYFTADQLIEMGVGKKVSHIGSEKGVDTKALKDQL